MKNTYWNHFFLITFAFITACNNQPSSIATSKATQEEIHKEHILLRDNLAHKEIIILEEQYKPPLEFGMQINAFYKSYLKLEEALVGSNLTIANNAAQEMQLLLNDIPEPTANRNAKKAWSNHKEGYAKTLTEFQHVNSLQEKRSYFSHISEILYCTFKSFDVEKEVVNVAYCPMAFNNKGAYWLADNKEIRNPYFGDKMLKCGSITEVIP